LEYPDIILNGNVIQVFDFDFRKKLSQNLDILGTSSTELVPVSLKWVEAYSAPENNQLLKQNYNFLIY